MLAYRDNHRECRPRGRSRRNCDVDLNDSGMDPGAACAPRTGAACPPIVTEGVSNGMIAGEAGIKVLYTADVVAPAPVIYITMIDPRAAGTATELMV